MLFALVFFTVVLGIYPSVVLDGLHYASSSLIIRLVVMFPYLLPLFVQKSSNVRANKSILLALIR